MKLLLHTCCAPCAVKCVESLQAEGTDPTLFWYNPNIHPWMEYKNRRETLERFAQASGLELILSGEYGLRSFIRGIYPDLENRCAYCYRTRLEQTAAYAAENGYDAFSTTLLISPYQKHDLICEIARQCGQQYGVSFLYRDFRPLFRAGQQAAREAGFYMQKYCGCVFSEEERYQPKKKKAGGASDEA